MIEQLSMPVDRGVQALTHKYTCITYIYSNYFSFSSTFRGLNGLYWNVNGVTVAGNGLRGSGLNELDRPNGIHLDSSDNLYIADTYNRRVMKYLPGNSRNHSLRSS